MGLMTYGAQIAVEASSLWNHCRLRLKASPAAHYEDVVTKDTGQILWTLMTLR